MGKKLLAALFAVMMSFFPARPGTSAGTPETAEGTARCLVVGMDLFTERQTTTPCSANNAEIMAALFADCLPEGTRVTRSVNGPGTAAGLSGLILDAFEGAGEKDTSFLYLSTHGELWETESGDTRAVLVLSDGTAEEAISAEALRTMMDRVPGRKVLILDCCHAGAAAKAFDGPEWRVIAGCAAEEDCYFQSAGSDTGTGYFTSALENALRASDAAQADPDGDGQVSLTELAGRIREIYGVSTAVFLPEEDGEPMFLLTEERKTPERLTGIAFESEIAAGGQLSLSFRFTAETKAKLEYRLVPAGEHGWDFDSAVRLPDRERTGNVRGLLYQVPVPEATRVLGAGEP